MMKIVKKSLSKVAGAWCDIQNYLASKNQLDAHNLDFNCQRLEPRELLSATPVGSGVPVENNINQTQIQASLSDEDFETTQINDLDLLYESDLTLMIEPAGRIDCDPADETLAKFNEMKKKNKRAYIIFKIEGPDPEIEFMIQGITTLSH